MGSTMLQISQNKITLVLVHSALEMALISLLLLNGLFSFLVAKFADYFRLKPPCIWCSRIDHIFEPSKPKSSSRALFCEDHAIEISKLGFCSDHKNLAERRCMCGDCSSFCKKPKEQFELGFSECSCCGANLGELGFSECEQEFVDKLVEIEDRDEIKGKPIDELIVEESSEEANKELKRSSDEIHERGTCVDSQKSNLSLERRESCAESLEGSFTSEVETGEEIAKLRSALRSERKALQSLYAELEEERSASAVAANQTMAMINRLQEEKAAMQMEALHYQRMMDEQAEYDHEALQLLNELLEKREKEKAELQREMELYRRNPKSLESRDELMMMKGCSCNSADDSDSLEDKVYALCCDDYANDLIVVY